MRTFIVVAALCACSQALKLADKVDPRPAYLNDLAAPPAYLKDIKQTQQSHTLETWRNSALGKGLNSFGGKPEEKAAEKVEKKEEKPAEKAEKKEEKAVEKEVKKEEKKAEKEAKKDEKKVETEAKKDEKSAEKAVKKEEKSVEKDVKKDEKSAEKGTKKDEEDEEDEEEKPKKCSDCVLKAKTCDCDAVTTYLECVRDSCDKGFADKCVKVQNSCFDDVDIKCSKPDETTCSGKFHQLSDGTIGLEHNKTGVGNDAYCGPNGKCLGEFHMAVNIHNPAPGVFTKCGVPKDSTEVDEDSVVDKDSDLDGFNTCTAAADNTDKASCDIPAFPNLEAGGETKSFCVLTDGKDGDFLTQVAWQKLSNAHKA